MVGDSNLESRRQTILSGTLPRELRVLTDMEIFWLDFFEIRGPLEGRFDGWSKVKDIRLFDNELTGPIPSNLHEITPGLESLWLDINKITGTIPATLGNLINLRDIRLGANRLKGSISGSLGNLQKLCTCIHF